MPLELLRFVVVVAETLAKQIAKESATDDGDVMVVVSRSARTPITFALLLVEDEEEEKGTTRDHTVPLPKKKEREQQLCRQCPAVSRVAIPMSRSKREKNKKWIEGYTERAT